MVTQSPKSVSPSSAFVPAAKADATSSLARRVLTPFRLTVLIALACVAFEGAAEDRLAGPILGNLEHGLGDLRFELRHRFGLAHPPEYVVVVAADQKSIESIGFWPWSRKTYADLIDKLTSSGATAIVFDMGFMDEREGSNAEDHLLAEATRRSGRVVQSFILLKDDEAEALARRKAENEARVEAARVGPIRAPKGAGLSPPLPDLERHIGKFDVADAPLEAFAKATPWLGFFNSEPDKDGILRRVRLIARLANRFDLPSIDVAGFGIACGSGRPSRVTPLAARPDDPGLSFVEIPCDTGSQEIPVDFAGVMLLNYQVPWREFPRVSTVDVLDGQVGTAAIAGKIALIAASAQGTYDLRSSPLESNIPGGITHATALEQMVSGRFLKRTPAVHIAELVFLLALGLLFGWLFATLRPAAVIPTLIGGLLGSYALTFGMFLEGYDVISALPLVELLLMAVAALGDRYFLEEKDRRQIRRAFGHYLTPSVMESVLADPSKLRLGGEKRDLTVLFSDVRGFTSLSERLAPEQLVTVLNGYLTPMTDLVFEFGGTLDKYMGDAIMAFFGAPIAQPDHALRAVKTADAMMTKLAELTVAWQAQGIPPLDIGIGVSSGPMVVGNMGSENGFRNYTVMGDTVNLGSRLEGTNKVYGTHVILAEDTEKAVRGAVTTRLLDVVRVKGKHLPVRIHELLAIGPPPPAWAEVLPDYERGVALYQQRLFAEAQAAFERVLAKRPSDKPSAIYVARCRELAASPPPEGWDGVFDLLTK